LKYSKIIGTGSYLPEKIVINADLEKGSGHKEKATGPGEFNEY
jgi:3-oxoacyl-[acyl-carrier-protein] synthase III